VKRLQDRVTAQIPMVFYHPKPYPNLAADLWLPLIPLSDFGQFFVTVKRRFKSLI
jgi:hypothetical protein